MSAKWRALQHRHRYTYNALIFPPSFLNSLPLNDAVSHFHSTFLHFTTLTSTYSQLHHAKTLASSFSLLLTQPISESTLTEASRIYLQLLFLENSTPLHRTLISPLTKTQSWTSLIGQTFLSLCEEYGGGPRDEAKNKTRFAVSRAVLSVLGLPKLGYLVDVVENCAVVVAWRAVVVGWL